MRNNKILIIIVTIAIAYGIVTIINKLAPKDAVLDDRSTTVKTVLEQKWDMHRIGDTGLALYTPESLRMIPTKLDDNAKLTLKSYNTYEYTLNTFGIRINHIIARNELNAGIYAEKLTEMLKMSHDITDYKFEIIPFVANGMEGQFVTATARQTGTNIEMGSAVLSKDETIWEVTVRLDSSSEKLKELAEKIFESIQIR